MKNSDIYQPRVPRRQSHHAIRDVDYAVSEWGDPVSPLVVWLHGWGDCGATFQFVVDAFALDWHVVAPDFRGFGGSRSNSRSFWFPDYLADLDALLSIYAPDHPVCLIGHSMGGNVGGLYAGTMPERIRAFVNVEGFGLPDEDPSAAPGRYRAWIERDRHRPRFASYDDHAALAARIGEENPRMRGDRARFAASLWGRDENGRVELRANPAHRLPNPVLYRRAEAEACWRETRAPVLLVSGSSSPVRAALENRGSVAGRPALPFPDCRDVTIDGAGHMLHFEAPEALAGHIEAFLRPLVNLSSTG